jgi:hypothetical protein
MTSAVPPAGAPHTLGSQPSTECPAAAGQAALAAGRHRGGAGADPSRRSAPRVARRDPIACSPSEPKRAPSACSSRPAPAAGARPPRRCGQRWRTRHASRPACRSSPVRSVGAATPSDPELSRSGSAGSVAAARRALCGDAGSILWCAAPSRSRPACRTTPGARFGRRGTLPAGRAGSSSAVPSCSLCRRPAPRPISKLAREVAQQVGWRASRRDGARTGLCKWPRIAGGGAAGVRRGASPDAPLQSPAGAPRAGGSRRSGPGTVGCRTTGPSGSHRRCRSDTG